MQNAHPDRMMGCAFSIASYAAMAGVRGLRAWQFQRCGAGAYIMRPYSEKRQHLRL